MGKSALTWKWFNDFAPQVIPSFTGRLWWSFYEDDATFENFIIKALAYVSRRSQKEVETLYPHDRENELLNILDREPFLFVLDGLERIMIGYASNEDFDKQITDSTVALNLPLDATKSYSGQHRLRKTVDPHAGTFLRKLANVRAARILISTRYYPVDLEKADGEPLPGSFRYNLGGLTDDDVLKLWYSFKVSGSREALLPFFYSFESYPLLIQLYAGEIANYRRAPGDFDQWRRDHPEFDPFSPILKQWRTRVLNFALQGLDEITREVLYTVAIASRRSPVNYDTLVNLLVRPIREALTKLVRESSDESKFMGFDDKTELDNTLRELEDRSLLSWDKLTNGYDMHPVVRGVVLGLLNKDDKQHIYGTLHVHFGHQPIINDWQQVHSLEDLTVAIELYSLKIDLERYDAALHFFRDFLAEALLFRLSAYYQYIELVKRLFPDGLDQLPRLSEFSDQAYALNALAQGYRFTGQLRQAVPLYRHHNIIRERYGELRDVSVGLSNMAEMLCVLGALCEAEAAARRATFITRTQASYLRKGTILQWLSWIPIVRDRVKGEELATYFQEAITLRWLGLVLAARGMASDAILAFQRSLRIFLELGETPSEGRTKAYFAQGALWLNDPTFARSLADQASELASVQRNKVDSIRAARLQGTAALNLNDLVVSDERLHYSLVQARTMDRNIDGEKPSALIEEEVQTLIGLAELKRRQGNQETARELLADSWNLAEHSSYPIFYTDTYNILAQIERDEGNQEAAAMAATQAYCLAWCDGPPFTYYKGLMQAQVHLNALGAPVPIDLPPYDETAHEPMPEIEINPPDEFAI